MATTKKTSTEPATDEKSEFLTELVERFAYWRDKKNKEYAQAYEHMIHAFTAPETKQ